MATLRKSFAARPRLLIPIVVAVVVVLIVFSVFTRLYTDLLFYRSVGFSKVFDTTLYTRVLLFVIFGLIMAVAIGTNIVLAHRLRPPIRPLSMEQQNLERYRVGLGPYKLILLIAVCAVFGLIAGLSASGRWQTWLLWRNGQSFGVKDPQFHRDVSYYAFTYPFQRFVLGFLFAVVVLSLVVAVVTHYLYGGIRLQTQGEKVVAAAKAHLSVLLGLFALLKAASYWLDRYGLNFSTRGRVTGASYTDVHAVLPAKLILLFISLLCFVLFIVNIFQRGWILPGLSLGILLLSSVVIGWLYPAFVQQFQVKPNEINREAPYIQRNIDATRSAYGIGNLDQSQYNATTTPNGDAIADDKGTIPNVRLLDPAVVSKTYEQLQQVRGYYGFAPTLDIDRYTVDGKTQDYVVAVRELDQSGLSGDQRNWINLHLAYTHGKGFVAAPGNTVDANGKPQFDLGAQNLPVNGKIVPKTSQIYFGEQSPDYSVVHTTQKEIDGPAPAGSQEDQATNTYEGQGGVSIGSTWRKFLFTWRFREKNLLLSSALTGDSKILYVRSPRDRVAKVAPWLKLDGDPYPAVVNGRTVWILDGYTTSDGFPYAERQTFGNVTADALTGEANRARQAAARINYIRNSVKATVDAYDGSVKLYEWDTQDPVLKTWEKVFPGTVLPKKDLTSNTDLTAHLRYPEDLFKVQRELIGNYHVTDARAFYSGEDFWAPSAQPGSGGSLQPPFYLYSQVPGQKSPQFNLTTAMINTRSSKLAAYLSVSSDPADYGNIRVQQLQQGVTINGPTQAQAAIEANSDVSRTLSLLRSGGSSVVAANLLTLPVGGGLLYVEPYYVQSTGDQGYPTLQEVAVAFGDNVKIDKTFSGALAQLFGTSGQASSGTGASSSPTPSPSASATGGTGGTGGGGTLSPALSAAIASAGQAFDDAQAAFQKGDFAAYGAAQARLKVALAQVQALAKPAATPSPSATPKPSPSASR